MYRKEKIEDLYHFLTTDGLVKRNFKLPFEAEGMRIETVIPPCFEGYAKIMIPWRMNSDASNQFFKEVPHDEIYSDEIMDALMELYLSDKSLYELQSKEREKKWAPYFKARKDYQDSINFDFNKVKNWQPVTWKAVCEIYEAHYHNEISPLSFDYSYKGQKHGLVMHESAPMPNDIEVTLFEILKRHTKSNLLVWNPEGQLEEISIQKFTPSQNNLWINYITKKREWMTYVGHESICITIGGTYDLIDDLLDCKSLEVLECSCLTRLDWHSDKINIPTKK